MLIRPYEEHDESTVVALWQECGLTRPWNDPHKDIARKLTVQRELFLVGTLNGEIIGTVMTGYEGHRGWVNYLAVARRYRSRGYGEGLMKHIEKLFTEVGCPKINLLVRNTNTDMIDFYRRLGYVQDEAVSLGKRLIPGGPVI